jgi:hypothetical protein
MGMCLALWLLPFALGNDAKMEIQEPTAQELKSRLYNLPRLDGDKPVIVATSGSTGGASHWSITKDNP